ncbi:hypothetical protein AUP68_00725 [Ilyonectria robusta]
MYLVVHTVAMQTCLCQPFVIRCNMLKSHGGSIAVVPNLYHFRSETQVATLHDNRTWEQSTALREVTFCPGIHRLVIKRTKEVLLSKDSTLRSNSCELIYYKSQTRMITRADQAMASRLTTHLQCYAG